MAGEGVHPDVGLFTVRDVIKDQTGGDRAILTVVSGTAPLDGLEGVPTRPLGSVVASGANGDGGQGRQPGMRTG
jgi:hypothetical protein